MSKIEEIELHVAHFGDGSGASGHIDEVKEARKVTQRVFDILKANKVPCTFFEDKTSKNRTQNINTLIKHHNTDRNGLIVSIHFNAGGDGSKAIGTEVLYYDRKALADKLVKAISGATGGGLKNRGSKQRKDLGVLASTYEPAVLIEVCFVNSSIDVAIYRRDFEKICQSIAKVLAAEIGYNIGQAVASIQTKPTPIEREEKAMAAQPAEFLNETGRQECREMIRRGVAGKLFISDHKNMDNYNDAELMSYSMAYLNRKNK